jgi:hypothetical protein
LSKRQNMLRISLGSIVVILLVLWLLACSEPLSSEREDRAIV